jgi:DnaJ-class molecular chaperone
MTDEGHWPKRPKVFGRNACGSCNGWGSNRNPVTRLRSLCRSCAGTGRETQFDRRAPSPDDQSEVTK